MSQTDWSPCTVALSPLFREADREKKMLEHECSRVIHPQTSPGGECAWVTHVSRAPVCYRGSAELPAPQLISVPSSLLHPLHVDTLIRQYPLHKFLPLKRSSYLARQKQDNAVNAHWYAYYKHTHRTHKYRTGAD